MIVYLIRNDIIVNDKLIPDISVGQHWGKFWTANNLDEQFGERIKYKHNYPDYYCLLLKYHVMCIKNSFSGIYKH